MDTITLILPDVAAEAGKHRIEDALRRQDGVQRATVDLAARWATITFDPDRISVWEIVVTIEEHGYDVGALVPAGSRHLAGQAIARDDRGRVLAGGGRQASPHQDR